jgi:ADP-heptose:LPS heptosyltransferase
MKQQVLIVKAAKRVLDRIFFSFMWRVLKRRRATSGKVLLFVRTDGIGDFAFFVRYLPSLKPAFADYRLVIVCRRETAELARCVPLINTVIPYKYLSYRHNYFYRLFVLLKIRSLSAALAAYVSFHREHIGDEMTILSGAPKTFAFSGNDECIHPSMRVKNNACYDCIVEAPDHSPEKEKYSAMWGSMSVDHAFEKDVAFSVGRKQEEAVAIYLRREFGETTSSYSVIGPGGSAAIKWWQEEKFAVLADTLIEKNGFNVVLCGERNEHRRLQSIACHMRHRAAIVSSFSLPQVVSLLRKAVFFVGNESGLLHLAATLGIPAVGILTGGHFSEYFPYGNTKIVTNRLPCFECNLTCIFERPLCITEVSVEDVLAKAEQLVVSGKSLLSVVGPRHEE